MEGSWEIELEINKINVMGGVRETYSGVAEESDKKKRKRNKKFGRKRETMRGRESRDIVGSPLAY